MRLINADALMEKSFEIEYADGWHKSVTQEVVSIRDIDNAPPIDAVEVVRCNDCKWYQGVHGVQGHAPCERFNKQVLWNDFCSDGEPYKGDDTE